MNEKNVNRIGWIGSIMATAMYGSYIDQIRLNLQGHPGSIVLPIITTMSCTTWMLYGWFKTNKDWPIIFCNIVGIVVGIATAVTAIH